MTANRKETFIYANTLKHGDYEQKLELKGLEKQEQKGWKNWNRKSIKTTPATTKERAQQWLKMGGW